MDSLNKAISVNVPHEISIYNLYPTLDLADAFAIQNISGMSFTPEQFARSIFSQPFPLFEWLLVLRKIIVTPFGLKKSLNDIGDLNEMLSIFKIYSKNEQEIIVGGDDKHLDFRISLLKVDNQIIVSTLVHCHNMMGKIYLFCVTPFHKLLVPHVLTKASKNKWKAYDLI
jgi:Protein of unknown function (DUF2867)